MWSSAQGLKGVCSLLLVFLQWWLGDGDAETLFTVISDCDELSEAEH